MTLSIHNLSVAYSSDKPIIKNLNLTVHPGTVHALMGPNGSGKSTLAYTLMGHPNYVVTSGSILYDDVDITYLCPDKRAKMGIFLSFQHPYEIPGVMVWRFLNQAYQAITGTHVQAKEFQSLLISTMERIGMDPSFAYRNLNEGFSGGEKKRLEMLQLLILKPKLIILDEIDSGLDIDALKVIAQGLHYIKKEHPTSAIIIITHYQRMLEYVHPDAVHIVSNGTITRSGTFELVNDLECKGYDAFQV